MLERTLCIIRPNAIHHLEGIILFLNENVGLVISTTKMLLSQTQMKKLYEDHKNELFFQDLIREMTSGPAVVCIIQGNNCIKRLRLLLGNKK